MRVKVTGKLKPEFLEKLSRVQFVSEDYMEEDELLDPAYWMSAVLDHYYYLADSEDLYEVTVDRVFEEEEDDS